MSRDAEVEKMQLYISLGLRTPGLALWAEYVFRIFTIRVEYFLFKNGCK